MPEIPKSRAGERPGRLGEANPSNIIERFTDEMLRFDTELHAEVTRAYPDFTAKLAEASTEQTDALRERLVSAATALGHDDIAAGFTNETVRDFQEQLAEALNARSTSQDPS